MQKKTRNAPKEPSQNKDSLQLAPPGSNTLQFSLIQMVLHLNNDVYWQNTEKIKRIFVQNALIAEPGGRPLRKASKGLPGTVKKENIDNLVLQDLPVG